MKDLRINKKDGYYNPDIECYYPENIAKINSIDDHDILINYKEFLENSFQHLVKICSFSPASDAWDDFTEENYSIMVYDALALKYKTNTQPAHKYGFNLHCYKKINHIECLLLENEIEVLSFDHKSKLKLKSDSLKYIGIAFIEFFPEINAEQDKILLSYRYIRAQLFDKDTGYIFNDDMHGIIYIPINQKIKLELVLEDYDEKEHQLFKDDRKVSISINKAFNLNLVELVSANE